MDSSHKKAPTVSATLDQKTFDRIEAAAKVAETTTSEFVRTILTHEAMSSTDSRDLAGEYFAAKAAVLRIRSEAIKQAGFHPSPSETGGGDVAEVDEVAEVKA